MSHLLIVRRAFSLTWPSTMHINKGKQINSRRITELVWAFLGIGYCYYLLTTAKNHPFHLGVGRGGRHVENFTVMVLKLTEIAMKYTAILCAGVLRVSVSVLTSIQFSPLPHLNASIK